MTNMTKQTQVRSTIEAMKLALENSQPSFMSPGWTLVRNEDITALREALAEQPAQQKPLIGETNVELGFYSNNASNGQQRELVGKVEMGQLVGNRSHESASNPDAKREIAVITSVDEYGPMLNWYTHWVNFPIGTKLYTSPPAQQEPVAEVVMAAKPPNASLAWLPFKIVHASLEWLDSVPVGTKLYTSPPTLSLSQRPHECSRSHPHENMDAMCELRTEIARLTNENARLKAQRKPLTDEQVARVLAQLPVPPTCDGSALHDWAMQAVRVLEKNQ